MCTLLKSDRAARPSNERRIDIDTAHEGSTVVARKHNGHEAGVAANVEHTFAAKHHARRSDGVDPRVIGCRVATARKPVKVAKGKSVPPLAPGRQHATTANHYATGTTLSARTSAAAANPIATLRRASPASTRRRLARPSRHSRALSGTSYSCCCRRCCRRCCRTRRCRCGRAAPRCIDVDV